MVAALIKRIAQFLTEAARSDVRPITAEEPLVEQGCSISSDLFVERHGRQNPDVRLPVPTSVKGGSAALVVLGDPPSIRIDPLDNPGTAQRLKPVDSGTGKTHVALGLWLAACLKGMSVSFTTAAALVNKLMEARDERRLLRVQKQVAAVKLLIIDELGFVPLSKTGAELLFEMISQCYERGATLITSNLPFDEWTETLGTERLTGALLDRLTHHVNVLEMNGKSYRLAQSRARRPSDNN